jgi:hypothetical protein
MWDFCHWAVLSLHGMTLMMYDVISQLQDKLAVCWEHSTLQSGAVDPDWLTVIICLLVSDYCTALRGSYCYTEDRCQTWWFVWSGILWPFSTLAVVERFSATDVTTKEEAMIYLSEVTSKTFSNFNILPTTVHEIRHYYLPSFKTFLWLWWNFNKVPRKLLDSLLMFL